MSFIEYAKLFTISAGMAKYMDNLFGESNWVFHYTK